MNEVDSVSSDTAKLLKDVTGESNLDSAVRITVEDAMRHRLERLEEQIEGFEQRYDMGFEVFEQKWQEGEIDDKHSYDVEKDYWEWEGLISRQKKLEEALEQLVNRK